MGEPLVVAACLAKNRAWVLPRWHAALVGQSRRSDAAYVLLNDNNDDSPLLLATTEFVGGLQVAWGVHDTGDLGDSRAATSTTPRYSTANLANLRNELIRRVLERWPQATHVWSVDSDVLPDPDVLSLLLTADLPVVSAVVRNSTQPGIYNFWRGWKSPFRKGDKYPHRDGTEEVALSSNEPVWVTMTGACVLVRRDVLDHPDVRYSDHPNGEDCAWSVAVQRAGWLMAVHPLARTRHVQPDASEWR